MRKSLEEEPESLQPTLDNPNYHPEEYGALMIRMGFWDPLYYNHNQNHQNNGGYGCRVYGDCAFAEVMLKVQSCWPKPKHKPTLKEESPRTRIP